MRVVETGNGPGFPFEPLSQAGSLGKMFWQDFNGHDAIQPRVSCLVHLSHAAGAQHPQNLVRTQPPPQQRHGVVLQLPRHLFHGRCAQESAHLGVHFQQ